MTRRGLLALALVAATGCATAPLRPRPEPAPGAPAAAPGGVRDADLPEAPTEPAPAARADEASGAHARLAARARTFIDRRGPFRVGGQTFPGDCSGFVQAVYAAEGIDLRALMQRTAPRERRGTKAAWLAAQASGTTFTSEGDPRPGDLVFWHDTYDRNRNGKVDDRFTHVGIVEDVAGGTVHFLHRGGRGVARGVMTLARADEARTPAGRHLNSTLRARSHPVRRGGLAAQLFAGFGRLDAASGDARITSTPEEVRSAPPARGRSRAAARAAPQAPAPRSPRRAP